MRRDVRASAALGPKQHIDCIASPRVVLGLGELTAAAALVKAVVTMVEKAVLIAAIVRRRVKSTNVLEEARWRREENAAER